ncbi:MAG: PQQ-binding-like beta-propeller repeat protein [Acidobacteriota bacterium]
MATAVRCVVVAGLLLVSGAITPASDWPNWRGPHLDGVSDETGLISSWSPEGEHVLWHADFVGRSTPVVVDGRACVIGRTGEGITRQEIVACYDAADGTLLWEYRFDVYHTTVPFNRVGWASLVADPDTGNVYAHGVAGQLIAFAPDGAVVWSHFLAEEFGHLSGYGGRTQTPIIVHDQVLISFISAGWGDQAAPRHRYFSFDKRTGDLVWSATPGTMPFDFNTQSMPVLATIKGREMIVTGNGDGRIYALDAVTGDKIWEFALGKRGLNSTVLVHGDRVYAGHSEENIDDSVMGRLVCIDATGHGDVTRSHEVWRIDELMEGFPSPIYKNGRLYVVDNSANLHSIDAATGKEFWTTSLGTVGKGSPVWADGKIYVTEVNGRFHILRPGPDGVEKLDDDFIGVPGGRHAEIYGSPAIAHGRIYFATENGVYCLGTQNHPVENSPRRTARVARFAGTGDPAVVQVVPAEILIHPGETIDLGVRVLDRAGHPLPAGKVNWSLDGVKGRVGADGRFTADAGVKTQTGAVAARVGEISGKSRVRVISPLPWQIDFDTLDVGVTPATWIGAKGKFVVFDLDGNKVLRKAPRARGLNRSALYMGPTELTGYTIAADVRGSRQGRRFADVGVINAGYTLDLQGAHQKIQVRSWASVLRMAKEVKFSWQPDTWYRMKLRVDRHDGKALVRGKVWPRDAAEPAEWTISVDDPVPVESGSPGLVAYTPVDAYYDNISVTVNP